MTSAPRLTPYAHGITAVDAQYVRPGLAAVHIVVDAGRAAIVDSGTLHSVPHVLAALGEIGVASDAVDWLLLTHVHLDHAGGAGGLMRALPNARAVLHPRGAPHMIDPSALETASIAVYGEAAYRALYGEIVPIAAERVVVTKDGQRIALGGRELEFLHTPGHALHHQAVRDHRANAVFTGDTFGIAYREFDVAGRAFVIPTTTPTQFDPDQLCASVDRILALEPQALYMTHYSQVTDVARLGADMKAQVRAFEALALAQSGVAAGARREPVRAAMRELWIARARDHGVTQPETLVDELLANDLDLNTDGLLAWLARRLRH